MEKSDFIDNMAVLFNGIIRTAEGIATEIENERETMGAVEYSAWLQSERARLTDDQKRRSFVQTLKQKGTPYLWARAMANFIEFDHRHRKLGVVVWQEVWSNAKRVIAGIDTKGWLFTGKVRNYVDGIRADTKAKVFSRYIEDLEQKPKREKKAKHRVFAYFLFYSNPEDRSKKAVQAAGEKFGFIAGSFSNEFYRMSKHEYRTEPAYIKDLEKAIEILKKEGIDITKAEHELRTAKERTKKKS